MLQPLAYRMRPRQLEDILGQEHLVGPGKIIQRMVQAKRLTSMILYGDHREPLYRHQSRY